MIVAANDARARMTVVECILMEVWRLKRMVLDEGLIFSKDKQLKIISGTVAWNTQGQKRAFLYLKRREAAKQT